ncbi:MAG: hypothetical protein ABWY16_16840 [Pedobacter sp.]|uniref:hypothetical protein n=1 Tax=Pedobacter sp. TaxID=1411316 RepID=UPI003393DA5C
MQKYYVNKNPQGNRDYEVHREDCADLPSLENRTYLGEFYNCVGAVYAAREVYATSNGCKICSYLCHTS